MERPDFDYLKKREQQEQAAADLASCPEAQRSHQEMAARYRAMQSGKGAQPRLEGGPSLHYPRLLGA
jgi:hypothetical protein